MTDDERLFSHARDLQQTAAEQGYVTHTAFLDLHQRTLLQPLTRENARDVATFFFGGYPDAERTVALFVPRFLEMDSAQALFAAQPDDNPLALLRLDKDRFSTLSHRDYLGALMGLQIKRELLGDILVDDGGAYLVCLTTARQFLLQNLTSAGRATLTVREVPFSAISAREEHFTERFASVASLRLDSVLGAAFSLSRTKAGEAITGGAVYVNSVQTLKADRKVEQGDKLVLRGKGKAVLHEVRGESKKGRIHVLLRTYG